MGRHCRPPCFGGASVANTSVYSAFVYVAFVYVAFVYSALASRVVSFARCGPKPRAWDTAGALHSGDSAGIKRTLRRGTPLGKNTARRLLP